MKKRLVRLVPVLLCILCLTALTSCFTKKTEPVPDDHEHVWNEGEITVQGDCQNGTKGEITYTCTICGATKKEQTDGHVWDEDQDKIIAKATCKDVGSLLRTCKKCGQKVTFDIPKTTTHKYGDARLVTPPTATSDGVDEKVCSVCGLATTFKSTTTYADYRNKVNAISSQLGGFTAADFGGGTVTANLGNTYPAPPVNPTHGPHPRVLFNQSDIPGIKTALNNGLNEAAAAAFREQVALLESGVLPEATVHGTNGTHNFSGQVLANIMALALDYQLTKNEISGYQAILAAKNYLKTIDIHSFSPDPERTVGNIMYAMACVYDWCHDLTSQNDRQQIVLGVQKKCCELRGVKVSDGTSMQFMEIGFPPSGQNCVAGHGSELQLLRDYLSFAIAIYDEYPGWWNYIGGRFYDEYVPVRNEFYKAGMVPQGVSQYAQLRFASDCYSALLIKAMTGAIPYDEAGMQQVIRTIYSHELPYGTFASGDGSYANKSLMDYGMAAMISSHLFNDATIRAQFEKNNNSYSVFGDGQYGLEQAVGYAAEELICSSGGVVAASNIHEGMDLIVYNGGWLGQMIARDNWGSDQAAVLMKIGVRSGSNHDHQDAGQFQIYYRGLLAGDTGTYDSYGKDHWRYYHQATIAHNCVLIDNGSSTKGYVGGQISHTQEPGSSLSSWASGSYDTGVVTGYAYGYADETKKTPTYAYIAGDITKAYDSSTVSEVTRRMLAVYDTDNADVPLFFFVFDNITAKNKNYKKTFLLHTVNEPTISGSTVTTTSGNGKLVLQNVTGDKISWVGGTGKYYLVDGTQLTPTREPYEDGFKGRIEITPASANLTDRLLNVMYVCDKAKSPSLTATSIGNSTKATGAVIGNTVAVFANSKSPETSSFSFTTTGSGTLTYYVSGVKAGNWSVKVGSNTQVAVADGGLLVFRASAGLVTLTPQ